MAEAVVPLVTEDGLLQEIPAAALTKKLASSICTKEDINLTLEASAMLLKSFTTHWERRLLGFSLIFPAGPNIRELPPTF